MKLLVMTNRQGKVIGTARLSNSNDANTPFGGRPVVDGGQTHEVVLPPELHHITSAVELHREVSRLIGHSQAE